MIKQLQAILQWLFMRGEALFNSAFGDRLNPLYHLGAITFFLFWIIAASGLYLYAFFETSVTGAYASVEALSRKQWFAGGLLRSLHRYASDAMVLTMLLHLLRHFAFDRFRGFRWFSWATGVALIWGVYVAGISGYMLPWDRMAQFVIVASFEWIDWLPGLSGTLARNVLYPESINDRFFSLLVFIHIGLPLLVLLLMFVHVQRAPKARTNPPRPIMLSLLLTLTALSLLRPALSQGGAVELGQVVAELDLDWFYLALFPLFDRWSPGQVWALVVGATLLLAVLPWLPPKFRRSRQGEFHLSVHPATELLSVREGETLLEAGLRQGLTLPYACRNGACGLCLCTVLHGSVDHGHYQRGALPDELRAQGKTLLCCATPRSDVEIEVDGSAVAPRRPEGNALLRQRTGAGLAKR